jgi:hypothetical protein
MEYVQSDLQHKLFSPGRNWWSLSDAAQLSKILPNMVTYWEQIGHQEDFWKILEI